MLLPYYECQRHEYRDNRPDSWPISMASQDPPGPWALSRFAQLPLGSAEYRVLEAGVGGGGG